MPGEPSSINEVAAALRTEIYSGQHPAGSRFRTREEIAGEHGVSAESAGVALRMLRSEGLVTLEQGRGTFVCKLADYLVKVTFEWQADDETAHRLIAEIQGRIPLAQERQPAVTTMYLGSDAWEWYWNMRIWAADAGRAGMVGLAAVRATAPGGWDMSRASVSAELAE